ncbi:hypothetical protein JHK87_017596 [Glycine soja]|nr:hypothetical protein JHK87_017596 [Glycine soja]
MADWGPVFVSVVLFILLTPGLLIQIPGKGKMVEFGNFQTSGVSILVHSILYFALVCIFLMAIGVHMNRSVTKGLTLYTSVFVHVITYWLL